MILEKVRRRWGRWIDRGKDGWIEGRKDEALEEDMNR